MAVQAIRTFLFDSLLHLFRGLLVATTVDGINPALPIIRIYPNSHSLGSLRSCRICIINSRTFFLWGGRSKVSLQAGGSPVLCVLVALGPGV